MQNILLGNRQIGEQLIQVISHTWEEYPTTKNGRERTDKTLYIEVDKENFNLLAMFYRNITLGDNAEGLASKVSMYYDLMLVKSLGETLTKKEFQGRYSEFDEFIYDSVPEYYTYVVAIY